MVNAFFPRNSREASLGLLQKFWTMVYARTDIPPAVRQYFRILAQRLRRSRGVSAVEYGMMLALIMCVVLGSLASLGTTLFSGVYSAVLAIAAIT